MNIQKALWTSVAAATLLGADHARTNPGQVLKELKAGNRRYVASRLAHPHQDAARRFEVAKGQHPGAVVLTCSDSRVPPEILFDEGLGDLFVIRVAGNIVTDEVLGSIEYAAEHLGSSLIVVLGHERCGAVEAAVQGGHAHGHIESLVRAIRPAVEPAKGNAGDTLERAVRFNVQRAVGQLRTAKPILSDLNQQGAVKIIGGIYDLDTGAVTLLP
jgi:carbonic anhydrase